MGDVLKTVEFFAALTAWDVYDGVTTFLVTNVMLVVVLLTVVSLY